MKQVLVLWDVDGTLIHNRGVSAETYAMAFEQLNGDPPVTPPETDGRTDYQIMRELSSANGRTLTDAMVRQPGRRGSIKRGQSTAWTSTKARRSSSVTRRAMWKLA